MYFQNIDRNREFLKHCDLLGHDHDKAQSSDGDLRYSLIPDLDTYRSFLGSTAEQRKTRVPEFFNPPIRMRSRLGQGLHDRGEAAVFAVHDLSAEDRKALAVHLPLHMKTHSIAHVTVAAGQVWDVSVRGDEVWGLDEMEELYSTLNIGTLVLEPGASLVVRGNVFVMLCQHLIVQEPRAAYQIGILPTPYSVDYGHGPMRGADGLDGANGGAGQDGTALQTVETFVGPRLRSVMRPGQLDGQAGGDGAPGGRGGHGRNGGMSKLAELTLRCLTGQLTVFAQAGQGGDGGDGGTGGSGGDGGAAMAGGRFFEGVIPSGCPGEGGRGGVGGDGGSAGNGGLASNIYITVPEAARSQVTRCALPSEPGTPGRGGAGGRGGAAGRSAGDTDFAAVAGLTGANGASGPRGRGRPAPWMFLNESVTQDDAPPSTRFDGSAAVADHVTGSNE